MIRGIVVRTGWRKGVSKRWRRMKRTTRRTFIRVEAYATCSSLTSVRCRKEDAKSKMMADPL